MDVAAGQAKFNKYAELEAEINRLKDLRGDGMSLGNILLTALDGP